MFIKVLSLGLSIYWMDPPPSMATIHPWLYTSPFKPTGSQPAGLFALEDDSYKDKAIILTKKYSTNAKVK